MKVYSELKSDQLIAFYYEVKKNIENGKLTKSMYYELGLIETVARLRGINLVKPRDFHEVLDKQLLANYIKNTCNLDSQELAYLHVN